MVAIVMASSLVRAHSGPPFPIVSNQAVGAYVVSIWTDPDTTDDGSAGGRFWVTVLPRQGATLHPETRVAVTIVAIEDASRTATVIAEPLSGVSSRYAALVMDREGRYRVRADIDGPLGPADVQAEVDATYDLRPPAGMLALYLAPFLVVGFLWVKLLLRRRQDRRAPDVTA